MIARGKRNDRPDDFFSSSTQINALTMIPRGNPPGLPAFLLEIHDNLVAKVTASVDRRG
jgi:hypothetical protein